MPGSATWPSTRWTASLLGMRQENGYTTLVRIPAPYETWNQIITLPYGQVLSELDISPDGKRLSVTMEEIDSKQYLRVFSIEALLAGEFKPVAQFDFGTAVAEGFVFSPDGRTCTAVPTTPACPTCSASRSPTTRSRR
jgi:hypothetical protein